MTNFLNAGCCDYRDITEYKQKFYGTEIWSESIINRLEFRSVVVEVAVQVKNMARTFYVFYVKF